MRKEEIIGLVIIFLGIGLLLFSFVIAYSLIQITPKESTEWFQHILPNVSNLPIFLNVLILLIVSTPLLILKIASVFLMVWIAGKIVSHGYTLYRIPSKSPSEKPAKEKEAELKEKPEPEKKPTEEEKPKQ